MISCGRMVRRVGRGPLVPLTVDGLIYANSMVMPDCARRCRGPALARCLLGLGITATLAANVAHSLGHGLIGALVAAWSAVALVGKVADCAIFARFCRARFGCWEGIRLQGAR